MAMNTSPTSSVRPTAKVIAAACLVGLLTACATPPKPFDYTAFKASRPASLLVLPPLNESQEVLAVQGIMTTAMMPLAEAGYYVMPASLVDETFRNNGLATASDIHDVSVAKLREIFGADAAVYIKVNQYGTKYMLVGSDTRVTIEGKIVDLRNGSTLWTGAATASSAEARSNSQAGLVGLLVQALVEQIVNTAVDASFNYASLANQRLMNPQAQNGILYGPRSPNFKKDVAR